MNEYAIGYIHEWNEGFNNSIAIEGRRIYSNRYVPMYTPDSTHVTSVASNQLHYQARFSWDENVTRGTFDKVYILTHYPIVTIDLITGVKGLADNDFGYFRAEATVDYSLPLPPVGTSTFHLTGGKIIGKVPYPLLKLHEGNGTYFLDKSSFACMDFYEFASDTWTTFFYEHNFKGFFLGKIPLMKKLQWREVFTLKAGYGTLSKTNNGITDGKIGNPLSTIPGTGAGQKYEGMEAPMLAMTVMSRRHYQDVLATIRSITCLDSVGFDGGAVGWSRTPGRIVRKTEDGVEEVVTGGDTPTYDVRETLLDLGGAVLCGFSGEVYTTIGLAVKEAIPKRTVVVNHTCSLLSNAGYIFDDATLERLDSSVRKVHVPGYGAESHILPGYVQESLCALTAELYQTIEGKEA